MYKNGMAGLQGIKSSKIVFATNTCDIQSYPMKMQHFKALKNPVI